MSCVLSPFAEAAVALLDAGLAPVPGHGKSPLISGFAGWRRIPSEQVLLRWAERFPDANVGLSSGPSGLVVVDVDQPALASEVRQLFGDTPIVVRTPSGGCHFWYRNRARFGCTNLRDVGLDVDIKGEGGFALCPPSRSESKGRSYRFVRGGLSDVPFLPEFPAETVLELRRDFVSKKDSASISKNPIGQRNNALFRYCLRMAASVASFDELLAMAREYNRAQQVVPEADLNVQGTASSAWQYHLEDRNFVHRPAMSLPMESIRLLRSIAGNDYPLAIALWIELRSVHRLESTFAISPLAMSRARLIPGLTGRRQIERARNALLETGILVKVAPHIFAAGRARQAAQYRFAPWAKLAHNTNNIPPRAPGVDS